MSAPRPKLIPEFHARVMPNLNLFYTEIQLMRPARCSALRSGAAALGRERDGDCCQRSAKDSQSAVPQRCAVFVADLDSWTSVHTTEGNQVGRVVRDTFCCGAAKSLLYVYKISTICRLLYSRFASSSQLESVVGKQFQMCLRTSFLLMKCLLLLMECCSVTSFQ